MQLQDHCQVMQELFVGGPSELHLPPPGATLLVGVRWGRFDEAFTPAYWAGQAWIGQLHQNRYGGYRLGETLIEEVAACLLGGHGMPAEVGLAAFEHLRRAGALGPAAAATASADHLTELLMQPLWCGGRTVRYRFPRQKARYLAPLLRALSTAPPPQDDHQAFRRWFLAFSGIGPKTASWITRNWLDSDEVAILDVHVLRAGLLCGLFAPDEHPARDYFGLEERFLAFARAIRVRAAVLDNLIWQQMRLCSAFVLELLRQGTMDVIPMTQ